MEYAHTPNVSEQLTPQNNQNLDRFNVFGGDNC